MVFRSAMVMLEFASPSSLDGYRDHVRQNSTRFGTQCWASYIKLIRGLDGSTQSVFAEGANTELTALDAIGVKGCVQSQTPMGVRLPAASS